MFQKSKSSGDKMQDPSNLSKNERVSNSSESSSSSFVSNLVVCKYSHNSYKAHEWKLVQDALKQVLLFYFYLNY